MPSGIEPQKCPNIPTDVRSRLNSLSLGLHSRTGIPPWARELLVEPDRRNRLHCGAEPVAVPRSAVCSYVVYGYSVTTTFCVFSQLGDLRRMK